MKLSGLEVPVSMTTFIDFSLYLRRRSTNSAKTSYDALVSYAVYWLYAYGGRLCMALTEVEFAWRMRDFEC